MVFRDEAAAEAARAARLAVAKEGESGVKVGPLSPVELLVSAGRSSMVLGYFVYGSAGRVGPCEQSGAALGRGPSLPFWQRQALLRPAVLCVRLPAAAPAMQ